MVRNRVRVAFPYAMIFAVLFSLIAGFGMMAEMGGWEIMVWFVGVCLVIGGIIFTFFEVRRLAGISMTTEQLAREEAEADREIIVEVRGPTGDPCPHHEDYEESAGLDQGQLTSRMPDRTPIIEDMLRRWRKEEEHHQV